MTQSTMRSVERLRENTAPHLSLLSFRLFRSGVELALESGFVDHLYAFPNDGEKKRNMILYRVKRCRVSFRDSWTTCRLQEDMDFRSFLLDEEPDDLESLRTTMAREEDGVTPQAQRVSQGKPHPGCKLR